MKKLLLILFCTLSAFRLSAQVWTGEEDADWNNPCNWSDWPLNDKMITIDPSLMYGACALPEIRTASQFIPAYITVQNGASLLIMNDLSVSEDLNVFDECSQVYFSGGRLIIGTKNKGRLVIADGSTIVLNGGSLDISHPWLVEQGGKLVQNGGTIRYDQQLPADAITAAPPAISTAAE